MNSFGNGLDRESGYFHLIANDIVNEIIEMVFIWANSETLINFLIFLIEVAFEGVDLRDDIFQFYLSLFYIFRPVLLFSFSFYRFRRLLFFFFLLVWVFLFGWGSLHSMMIFSWQSISSIFTQLHWFRFYDCMMQEMYNNKRKAH